jgi:hypothetical protein
MGSQKLDIIRFASAKDFHSKTKVKEALARKFIKMIKKREEQGLDKASKPIFSADSGLAKSFKSTMTNVCSTL